MYSRYEEIGHIQACIADTESRTSLICNDSISCFLVAVELLCKRTMLGSCAMCGSTSKNMGRSLFAISGAKDKRPEALSLASIQIIMRRVPPGYVVSSLNWKAINALQCVPIRINIGERAFVRQFFIVGRSKVHLTALLRPMSACITAAYLNSESNYIWCLFGKRSIFSICTKH